VNSDAKPVEHDGAPGVAAQQADTCLEAGDLDGKAVWMGLIRAIKELTNTDSAEGGQPVH